MNNEIINITFVGSARKNASKMNNKNYLRLDNLQFYN